jgi:hypothetical protein
MIAGLQPRLDLFAGGEEDEEEVGDDGEGSDDEDQ